MQRNIRTSSQTAASAVFFYMMKCLFEVRSFPHEQQPITGTQISTISVKSDYRERLNTLKLNVNVNVYIFMSKTS